MSKLLEKEDLCFYGSISYLITGAVYFYYLNSIIDCDCVNKTYIKNIKFYYMVALGTYLVNCIRTKDDKIDNILSLLIIISNFAFVYNVRLLINDIYKKNCECADTKITTVLNILNMVSIVLYIQFIIMLILMLILILYTHQIHVCTTD